MKNLIAGLILLVASTAFAAVALDDVVTLSKAGTSDEVILQLIQKEGLANPITSKDVVYLKQQGVSDRVIQYLMKVSAVGKSQYSDKNLRSYYTTTKTGKQIRVVTNLDENGKRMGGEVPPDPAPATVESAPYERPPQEIRVVVEGDSRPDYREYQEEYPEYVDERYTMPPWPTYYPYSGYYPYPDYGYYPGKHHGNRFPNDPNRPNWRYEYGKNRPLVQPRQNQAAPRNSKPASGGVRARGIRG